MMKTFRTLLPCFGALIAAIDFEIPAVASIVSKEYSEYPNVFHVGNTAVPTPPPRNLKSELHGGVSVPKYAAGTCDYWMETLGPQGIAAFNPNTSYNVFRNVVTMYGAKGDGVTDDTAAINLAISDGFRSGPSNGTQTTIFPAVVYFPPGVYVISNEIVDFYYTQIIGNPNCLPTIVAAANFSGAYMIDGDKGDGFSPTTILFWRQIRNFILDMTLVPSNIAIAGISWSTAQATSLQNIVFQMTQGPSNQTGLAMADGSGGFLTDLIFVGGQYGMMIGNQQFTMRNLSFTSAQTAIQHNFDWGWTFQGISINSCGVGINFTNGGYKGQNVASITVIDSEIVDTPLGFVTVRNITSLPPSAGSLILENVAIDNVPIVVQEQNGNIVLNGTTSTATIAAWTQGHIYVTSKGQQIVARNIAPVPRPPSLLSGTSYYTNSKPQYRQVPVSGFVSVRNIGAAGDGITDDTVAVQKAINKAVKLKKVLFFPSGTYKVTKTILFPPGSQVVGESYSVIMSSGSFFADETNPQPVVRVGNAGGQKGRVEWSDMIVSTQGRQPGAILIEWNMISPATHPSGMWDVHSRVGGFTGSNLLYQNCPTTPNTVVTQKNYNKNCVAGYMTMHVTPAATGLYMENVWLWTADHEVNAEGNQITVYIPRGFLCESTNGIIWMYGTAVEHHTFYQYQLVNTKNMFLGQIQTETPYYQPNPMAPIPFTTNASLNDPTFPHATYKPSSGALIPNADAWGLRIVDSNAIVLYGAGHYSFFKNYNNSCASTYCQGRIVSLESSTSTPLGVYIYDLHTVGTYVMLSAVNGATRSDLAYAKDNNAGFPDEVAAYKPYKPT